MTERAEGFWWVRLGNEWEVARVSRRIMLDGSAATFVDGVGGCAVLAGLGRL